MNSLSWEHKYLDVNEKFIRGMLNFGRELKVFYGNAKAVYVNEMFIAELCLLYTKFGKKRHNFEFKGESHFFVLPLPLPLLLTPSPCPSKPSGKC